MRGSRYRTSSHGSWGARIAVGLPYAFLCRMPPCTTDGITSPGRRTPPRRRRAQRALTARRTHGDASAGTGRPVPWAPRRAPVTRRRPFWPTWLPAEGFRAWATRDVDHLTRRIELAQHVFLHLRDLAPLMVLLCALAEHNGETIKELSAQHKILDGRAVELTLIKRRRGPRRRQPDELRPRLRPFQSIRRQPVQDLQGVPLPPAGLLSGSLGELCDPGGRRHPPLPGHRLTPLAKCTIVPGPNNSAVMSSAVIS